MSIWTLPPYGVSVSVSAQLQSGWVGIPFWKRRHLFPYDRETSLCCCCRVGLTTECFGYLGATQCGLTSHTHESIDITSSSTQARQHQGVRVSMTPLSAPFRGIYAGMPVIARHDAATSCPYQRNHEVRKLLTRDRPDKTSPYLACTPIRKADKHATADCYFESIATPGSDN